MIPVGLITKGIGAVVGGIRSKKAGGTFKEGAATALFGDTSGGGSDPEVAEGIAEVNEKVDTLIAAHEPQGTTQDTTQLSNPVPPTNNWSQDTTQQSPATNGTGGGNPTFAEPRATQMSAVADPNQNTLGSLLAT